MQSESKFFTSEEVNEKYIQIKLKDSSYLPKVSEWENEILTKNQRMHAFEKLDIFHSFPVREDDIWIITNDRCGTTWTQEMTWLILNDLNFQQARIVDLELRSQFLELPTPIDFDFEEMSSPRLMKTHLPMQLLPKDIWIKKPKIIYVVRDPRDAFVSSFHQIQFFLGVNSVPTVEDFVKELMDYGCFWQHVLSFYKIRNQENVIFFSFEQMKKDLRSIVLRVCDFVGKTYRADQIKNLLEHLDFQNMKDNESCSHRLEVEFVRRSCDVKPEDIDPSIKFIRNGLVGGHKKELSAKFLESMDKWEKGHLEKYGLCLNDFLFS